MSHAAPKDDRIKLFTLPQPHNCSYLPNQLANSVFLDPRARPNTAEYSQLTQMGFRRSGHHYYKPHCPSCRACLSSRVRCQEFVPSKSQKRVIQRNQDIQVSQKPVNDTEEYFELYSRYIEKRHANGDMYPPSREQYEQFILSAPESSFIMEHRLKGELVCAALTDSLEDGWSAIYTFFDPSLEKRSLGVWSILSQIQRTQQAHLPYLYLGYWIEGCQKMSYKMDYQPQELYLNHQWLRAKKPSSA